MLIQWYSGHMYKASKEIKQILPTIDLIVEVLDARIPFSSQNPMLSALRGSKPYIRILHKADLADTALTQQWQDYFKQQEGIKTLCTTTQQPEKIKQISSLCHKIIAQKGSSDKLIKTMIMGIPNVGKSTLVNILAQRTIAKTGNTPAITKYQQRIRLANYIVLTDTPGVLWGNIENKNSGYRLAATGAIKDTAMGYTDVAFFVASYLISTYPQQLKQRYQLDYVPDNATDLIQLIGSKRGCLRAGKQVDIEKTAKILITELRAGMIGSTTLETPDMMHQERIQLDAIRAQKATQKITRKRAYKALNKPC